MSTLDSLIRLLRLDPNPIQPSNTIFPRISIDKISRDLALESEAAKRGRQDQPASDATGLDSFENRIVEAVSSVRREGFNTYNTEMRVYAERMSDLDIDGYVTRIANSLRDGIAEFRERAHVGVDHLFLHRDHLKELKAEVDAFRDEHRLRRIAHYPESHLLGVGVIVVILVIEAVINGTYFMQANELGLAGGVITAVVLAGVNISFCGMFGYLSRYACHRRFVKKLFGILSAASFFAFVSVFNLFVGHFREAASMGDWNQAAQIGVSNFAADPVGLRVFDSWILVLLGIMFGIVAFVDGLKWDDPYPYFGNLWRRWRDANGNYVDEKSHLLQELRERKDRTLDEIDDAREEIAKRVRGYLQTSEFRSGVKLGLPIFLNESERAVNILLAKYREINRTNRKRESPKHFSEEFHFPDDDRPSEAGILELSRTDIATLTERADKVFLENTEEMLSEFEATFQRYDQISTVIQEITGNAAKHEQPTKAPAVAG